MAAKKYVQCLTQYQAGAGNIIGATSVVLQSFTDIYSNAITSITAFGDKGYGTAEPDTTNEEGFTFTSVTVNANGTVTLGGVSTILAQSPYTETSGLVRQHGGGTKIVITDNVAFWNTFGNKNNDEVLTGRWSTGVTPINPNDVSNKAYVDSVAVAGAPNANTTTKGIVQEATVAQVNAATSTGSTGAILFASPADLNSSIYGVQLPSANQKNALVGNDTSIAVGTGNKYITQTGLQNQVENYAVDSGTVNALVVTLSPAPTAYTAGMVIRVKIANTITGATTLNANGLGAKNVTKRGTTALVPNDLLINEVATFEYDGTQFQIEAPNTLNQVLVVTTPVSASNTNVETTLATVSIPGNTLGTNNGIEGRLAVTIQNTSTTADNLTIRLKYGTTTVANFVIATTTTSFSVTQGYLDFLLFGNAATNAQKGSIVINIGNGIQYVASVVQNVLQGGIGTATEDSTAAKTFSITAQWATAQSGAIITMDHGVIKRII